VKTHVQTRHSPSTRAAPLYLALHIFDRLAKLPRQLLDDPLQSVCHIWWSQTVACGVAHPIIAMTPATQRLDGAVFRCVDHRRELGALHIVTEQKPGD